MTGARPRPLDRLGLDAPILDLQEALGRCGKHVRVRRAEIRRERRRIHDVQGLIREPWISRGLRAEPLREVHLIAIAFGNVTLDALETGRISLAREIR